MNLIFRVRSARPITQTTKAKIATLILTLCVGNSVAIGQNSSLESVLDEPLEQITVYGEQKETSTATRLDLTVFETPQTVTVVSRPQIEDFALQDVNELLSYTPGVTVEYVETDRVYFTARGFDIVNFQYDGIGVPFSAGLSHGHQDTAIFEQVEVVKGAAGLITGFANPSATVNYIRKRPSQQREGFVNVVAGDDSRFRLEGDVSASLSSRIQARLVVAKDNTDSYLDRRKEDDSVYYGIIEADISDSTKLTMGHSVNRNRSDGSMSGALPLHYTDGTQTDYDVQTSTAPDWAFRDIDRTQTFLELSQHLSDSWSLTALLTQNKIEQFAEELYVYGTPDRETELGLFGYGFAYGLDEKQQIADVFVSGSFSLGGREHDMVVGANYADITLHGQSFYDYTNGFPVLGADWAQGNTPELNFVDTDPYTAAHQDDQTHKSLYFASRLKLADSLSVLLGARRMKVSQSGFNYGSDVESFAAETIPYFGLTYDVTDSLAFYGSYSEVFTPQSWVTPDFQTLGVAEGDNSELGAKFSLNDNSAIGTVALFKSKLQNLGEFNSVINGVNTYLGLDYQTQGAELELSGRVSPNINVSFGFTWLDKVTGDDGQSVRTYVPRKLLKLATAWRVQQVPGLSVGASAKWQDDIINQPQAGVTVTQPDYVLLNAFARYALSDSMSLALNISNLTDEKYINSLYWTQGFYGAPRQSQFSLNWKF